MKVKIGKYPKGSGDRKVEVRIDPQDLWNLDVTLAAVIAPALKAFRDAKKNGLPSWSFDEPGKPDHSEEEWTKAHVNFAIVMNKMIRAFELVIYEEIFDDEPFHKYMERRREQDKEIQEGLELFAKHFMSLWD